MSTASGLRLIAATLAAGAVVAAPAVGASWTAAKYPTTSGSAAVASSANQTQSPIAVAVTASGVPAVLYRAANKSIWDITRGSATAAWPSKATQWLSTSANASPMLGAAFVGSKLTAMWPVTGGGSLAAASGSRSVASSAIAKRTINPPIKVPYPEGSFVPAFNIGAVSSGAAWYGISSALATSTGRAFGGLVAAGKVPTNLLPFAAPSVGGEPTISMGSDSLGNMTAVVRSGDGILNVTTRPASTSSWTALQALSPQPVAGAADSHGACCVWTTSPFAAAVDPAGDAVIAYATKVTAEGVISSTGTSAGVVAMQRVGATGTFGAPQVLQVIAPTTLSSGVVVHNVPRAITVAAGGSAPNATASVAWIASDSSAISAARGPVGAPLTAPLSIALPQSASGWTALQLTSAINPQGIAAVLLGGANFQGTSWPLLAITSAPGSNWSNPVAVSGTKVCAAGYPGATVAPYNTGFVAAWMCANTGGTSSTAANAIGVASFR